MCGRESATSEQATRTLAASSTVSTASDAGSTIDYVSPIELELGVRSTKAIFHPDFIAATLAA